MVLPTLVIRRAADDEIRRHSKEAYPNESCGALIGRGRVVTDAIPVANTADEDLRTRFRVGPVDYREIERRASEMDAELLGFYHSHPDDMARPSQYDLDHAWPTFAYVIVSVEGDEATALRAWRLREDRAAFDEQAIEVGLDDGLGCENVERR